MNQAAVASILLIVFAWYLGVSSPLLLQPRVLNNNNDVVRRHCSSARRRSGTDAAGKSGISMVAPSRRRFARTATNVTATTTPTVLTIRGINYDLTEWARAHPGGIQALRKHRHHRQEQGTTTTAATTTTTTPDATGAFERAGHSDEAWRLLEKFRIEEPTQAAVNDRLSTTTKMTTTTTTLAKWKKKLVTREDPQYIHKVLGVYALLHFAYRMYQMLFGKDLSAGLGGNLGRGANLSAVFCVLPHLVLSFSSFIFDTVPRERVVGKPMIWKENRVHSIIFGTRSILCTLLAWASVRFGHTSSARTVAVSGSALCVLSTMVAADIATAKLGPSQTDSSVATLPFWEDCSVSTQRRLKKFYAFTQFVATATCLSVGNPAWPFLMLFPIQIASFLLTLSRKGLIGGAGWHLGYGASLVLPFFAALRAATHLRSATFVSVLIGTSGLLFGLRCLGINKYALWTPVLVGRVLWGDRIVPYQMW